MIRRWMTQIEDEATVSECLELNFQLVSKRGKDSTLVSFLDSFGLTALVRHKFMVKPLGFLVGHSPCTK